MLDTSQEIKKGTTTVGLIFDGGVVLVTEMRATMGNMIASKRAKKIYQITPRIGLTIAGGVGDAQQLVRILQVECNLFEMRRGKTMSVGAASTLLSNYLNQNRYYPYYVQLLMGGFDEGGPSVYSVDAMGGATKEEDIVATGSGSPFAYGVLEDQYRPDMKEDDAKDLAVRAVRSAMRRDSASGEDIMVVVITKDKYEEHIESGLQRPSVARPTP